MRHYSDFWLSGGLLSPEWATRPDLPEPDAPDDAADALENLAMADWLHLPEAVRQEVVAAYMGSGHRRRPQPSGTRRAVD